MGLVPVVCDLIKQPIVQVYLQHFKKYDFYNMQKNHFALRLRKKFFVLLESGITCK